MNNISVLPIKTENGGYNVYIGKSVIERIDQIIAIENNRKALVITDNGVPEEYAKTVAERLNNAEIFTIPQGETSKSLKTLEEILAKLVESNFTRTDCIVAVGGGVVGDISGFAASMYMRGIDFYNVPTTVLSQVDSSVGGKTAIDFMGLKNILGAFYPPKAVVIDINTLKTLPKRQISNGLAESVKMAMTHDEELFEMFENGDAFNNLEEIIYRSVKIKQSVVEADEKESGLRRVLNFGHTLAHGIEAVNRMENYYHGECVAMGMLPMCDEMSKKRLISVLKSLDLPFEFPHEQINEIISACAHDKKASGSDITLVYVPKIGEFEFKKIGFSQFEEMVKQVK